MKTTAQKIKDLRNKIDAIDAVIIKRLSQRNRLSLKMGQLKAKSNINVKDTQREEQLMRRYEKLSLENDLNATFIKKLFKTIILYSRKVQK